MGSHVAAPVLTPNLKYDPVADFVPIGFTAHSPAVIIARKDFPAKDLKEFVAALRQRGDAVKQAHGGIGASSHMACLLFTAEIGAKPALVAYRGSGPALNDLVGGHVDFMCEQSVSVAESVLAGSVKAFAVSAAKRLETLPDVPTAREAGINYEMSVWAGLFAPKGVLPEIIARLSDALDRALDEAVVRERIAQLGGSIRQRTNATRLHSIVLFGPRSHAGHPFLPRPEPGNDACAEAAARTAHCLATR